MTSNEGERRRLRGAASRTRLGEDVQAVQLQVHALAACGTAFKRQSELLAHARGRADLLDGGEEALRVKELGDVHHLRASGARRPAA